MIEAVLRRRMTFGTLVATRLMRREEVAYVQLVENTFSYTWTTGRYDEAEASCVEEKKCRYNPLQRSDALRPSGCVTDVVGGRTKWQKAKSRRPSTFYA